MNPLESDKFEKELRRLKAAPVPPDLLGRLELCRKDAQTDSSEGGLTWLDTIRANLLWWLAPAAAVCIAAIVWLRPESTRTVSITQSTNAPTAGNVAKSELEIDRDLVDSYEVVADLPTGVPVRFRLDQWQDTVVYRDKSSGIAVERRVPRFEVVPVRFESY